MIRARVALPCDTENPVSSLHVTFKTYKAKDKVAKENVAYVVQCVAFVVLCGNDQTSKLVIGNFGENIWSIEAKIQIQTCPPATRTSHLNLSGGLSFYPLNISQCKST